MFNISKFKEIYSLLEEKKLKEANKLLIENRKEYYLHPEYLFLMAKYLKTQKKLYQALDCLHASLQHNYDNDFLKKKKYEKSSDKLVEENLYLILQLSEEINNSILITEVKNVLKDKDNEKFSKKLDSLMPGVQRKN